MPLFWCLQVCFARSNVQFAGVRSQLFQLGDEARHDLVVRLLAHPGLDAVHVLARGLAQLTPLLRNEWFEAAAATAQSVSTQLWSRAMTSWQLYA